MSQQIQALRLISYGYKHAYYYMGWPQLAALKIYIARKEEQWVQMTADLGMDEV